MGIGRYSLIFSSECLRTVNIPLAVVVVTFYVFLAGSRPTRPEVALSRRGLLSCLLVDVLIAVVFVDGLGCLIRLLSINKAAAVSRMVRRNSWLRHVDL